MPEKAAGIGPFVYAGTHPYYLLELVLTLAAKTGGPDVTKWIDNLEDGAWKDEASQTWPSTDGLSGNGTSGVITSIKGGEGTIGYADASQAGGLGVVSIKVGSSYNAPSADGAAAVVANSDLDPSATDSQLIYDVNRTDTTDGAYPLLLVSYLLACPTYADASTAAMVKGYLTYIVSQEGQQAGCQLERAVFRGRCCCVGKMAQPLRRDDPPDQPHHDHPNALRTRVQQP